jgi:hypothetical protein
MQRRGSSQRRSRAKSQWWLLCTFVRSYMTRSCPAVALACQWQTRILRCVCADARDALTRTAAVLAELHVNYAMCLVTPTRCAYTVRGRLRAMSQARVTSSRWPGVIACRAAQVPPNASNAFDCTHGPSDGACIVVAGVPVLWASLCAHQQTGTPWLLQESMRQCSRVRASALSNRCSCRRCTHPAHITVVSQSIGRHSVLRGVAVIGQCAAVTSGGSAHCARQGPPILWLCVATAGGQATAAS